MNIIALFKKAVIKKILNPIDVYFAITIAQKEKPDIIFAAACMSYFTNLGNSCLPLSHLYKKLIFKNKKSKLIDKLWNTVGYPKDWNKILLNSNIVSNGSTNSPLVISNHKLYLYYLWKSEKIFIEFISNNKKEKINVTLCKIVLESLYCKQENKYQKIAIAMAMIWKNIFIMGGPGTGKTTTIAKILVALIRISKKKLIIKLATPTGKASARLTESLKYALETIKLKTSEKNLFPSHAITLHTLLGIKKNNNIPFFNSNNLLNIDILIIDESSMIDLWLMAQLITALPKKSKVVFLGDINQLPSVQPGSILKDIYSFYKNSYSKSTAELLQDITQCNIKNINKNHDSIINDSICILNKNYRFNPTSDIALLENDLKTHNINNIKKIFYNGYKNIKYHEINNKKKYFNMIQKIVKKYRKYMQKILKEHMPEKIIKKFHHYRVLCAIKNGPYGIKKINAYLEKIMIKNKIIEPCLIDKEIWYIGKPIMILENNSTLNLLNGDVGITLLNDNNELSVFFILKKSIVRSIPINLLPKHETTWAITIHKSQGSEFSHVILIFPNSEYPILTQEILYTAITRTCNKLTIYANKKIFLKTALKKNIRYSLLS